MSVQRKKQFRKSEGLSLPVQTFIKTQIIAAVAYPLLFFAVSVISLSADLPEKYMFYATVLSLAAGSFACAAFAGSKLHKNGMVTGLLFCLPLNTVFMLISVILNSLKIDLTAAVSYFILIVASMLGGIVSVNTKTKPKIKVK